MFNLVFKGDNMPEALFEVMPTQQIRERTIQEYYANEYQRNQLEMAGFIPQNPSAKSGIAVKTIREILA